MGKNFNFIFIICWLILYVSAALALGVKESSLVNNLFTLVNIGVVLFVIIAGSFKGKLIALFLWPLKHYLLTESLTKWNIIETAWKMSKIVVIKHAKSTNKHFEFYLLIIDFLYCSSQENICKNTKPIFTITGYCFLCSSCRWYATLLLYDE
jgi:amino acid transporter